MGRVPSILFIHDRFPAQFGSFGRWLATRGWDVTFATTARGVSAPDIRILPYSPHRESAPETHPYALAMDRAAIQGQAFARAALEARRSGYRPDIIMAHSGWGSGLYARDVFPQAAFVAYCEWWYRYPGPDTEFLAELEGRTLPAVNDSPMLERSRNAPIALDIAGADAVICPTRFQAAQFPQTFRDAITVLHDGIDTTRFKPEPGSRMSTLGGLVPEGAKVVTYATRGMEPHRGFPQFMAALPLVFRAVPNAVAVIAGENRVAYGGDAVRKIDWKARALAENDLDPARIHFVGHLPADRYLELLRRSDAHVYLTVPFVLSWSMLEAMSTGCALVASDTEPVREFADPTSAHLVQLGSPESIASAIIGILSDVSGTGATCAVARERVEFDLSAERIYRSRLGMLRNLQECS
jgi:glycosyltransferase involved in cell wall biosynthesis